MSSGPANGNERTQRLIEVAMVAKRGYGHLGNASGTKASLGIGRTFTPAQLQRLQRYDWAVVDGCRTK